MEFKVLSNDQAKRRQEFTDTGGAVGARLLQIRDELDEYADSEHSPDLCDQPGCLICANAATEL